MGLTISLKVNGKAVTREVSPSTLLVEFLRQDLQLTGTHVGCDTAQCGACTVHVDGRAMREAFAAEKRAVERLGLAKGN